MSQHNIIGSEAFDRKPFVIVRSFRAGGLRRRRASATVAYLTVALIALAIGAVVAAVALAPQLADAQSRGSAPVIAGQPLTPPAVPGSSNPADPEAPALSSAAPTAVR